MKHLQIYILAILLNIGNGVYAQLNASLREHIQTIVADKRAKVGVSILTDKNDTLSINGNDHFPMQSVFKFHIALTVLSLVDEGKLSLDQLITIKEDQLLPGLYSPLRDTYPKGATLKLSQILKYTVSKSDNVGCDVLLRLVGGPQVVEQYIRGKGFSDFSVKINEEEMQNNWDMQFLNWTTPITSSRILFLFYNKPNNVLSSGQHDFIWKLMTATETGKKRIKGHLPGGTVVSHKTGWSGTNKEGITAAVNDVGIVFLPGGGYFIISIFITDSQEDLATNEGIIADIAKAAFDYLTGKK